MAELSAAIGAGAVLGSAAYAAATGFAARHESTHAQQVAEMRRLVGDFEGAYRAGEVAEGDWRRYQAIRDEARRKEAEYEESIEAYKETPLFSFVRKWRRKRAVRRRKKALRRANASLRSHYYDSTSEASDTSSITAASGSPPRARPARLSDEDDARILSWAEDVANSDSDEGEMEIPSLFDADERDRVREEVSETRRRREERRRGELREGYVKLKGVLPDLGHVESKPALLDRAAQHIVALENIGEDLWMRIREAEAELQRLQIDYSSRYLSGVA